MKNKFITILLALSLMLTACSSEAEDTISEETQVAESESVVEESQEREEVGAEGADMPGVGVVSPYIEVNSSDDFKLQLDIKLEAPQEAVVNYYIVVSNTIAQIDYTKNEIEYTLRASKTVNELDLHGVHGEVSVEGASEDISQDNQSVTITVVENIEGVKVATAVATILEDDKIYYSLTTSGDVELEEVMNDLLAVITDSNVE